VEEVVIAYFVVVLQHLIGGAEENNGIAKLE
jgi:hypothetical protein